VLNDGIAYKWKKIHRFQWEKYRVSNEKSIYVLMGKIYRFQLQKYRGSNGKNI
jgi:hypothetical protein